MYIPFLANVTLDGNKVGTNIKINLKGILIGNGVLVNNDSFYETTQHNYWIKRNLFDYKTSYALQHQCAINSLSVSCSQAQNQLRNVT